MTEGDEWEKLNRPTGREEFDSPNRFDLSSVAQVTELARRVRPQGPPRPPTPPASAPRPEPARNSRGGRKVFPQAAQAESQQAHPQHEQPYHPRYEQPPYEHARYEQPQYRQPPPPPAAPQQTPPPRQPPRHTPTPPSAPHGESGGPHPSLPPHPARASSGGEEPSAGDPAAPPPPRFTHRSLVRPYARTGGRTRPANDLALEALVATTERGRRYEGVQSPEQRYVCDLCVEVHSVAEIAAFAKLPLGVVKIVVDDLAEVGAVDLQQPGFVLSDRDSRDFMERILTGLRAL